MDSQVAFYQLSRKVVSNQADIPEDARQVMYYSLAIGHHVGVMDCFSEIMSVPSEEYERFLKLLPDGEARSKLEGVLTWNEIEINRGHVDDLLPALKGVLSNPDGSDSKWIKTMILCLQKMVMEPALYLMVKMRQ